MIYAEPWVKPMEHPFVVLAKREGKNTEHAAKERAAEGAAGGPLVCPRVHIVSAMPRLHVAVLDEELPYPLTSGKRIRTFNLLTQLSKTHRVTYIAHRNPDEEEVRAAAKALCEHDIFPIVVEHQIPPKAGVVSTAG